MVGFGVEGAEQLIGRFEQRRLRQVSLYCGSAENFESRLVLGSLGQRVERVE
jgi:hypothetical protein